MVKVLREHLEWKAVTHSRPGGQQVVQTRLPVMLTFKPAEIAVVCGAERSQHKNRQECLRLMKACLEVYFGESVTFEET